MIKIGNKVKCHINDGMFGLFFEDINYGLDGGLHAEMIENRSFEFFDCGGSWANWYKRFDGLYGWTGDNGAVLSIKAETPVSKVNPHYLRVSIGEGGSAFSNKAYDGIYMEASKTYNVSFYARTYGENSGNAEITVEIRQGINGSVLCAAPVKKQLGSTWEQYTLSICSEKEIRHGAFCIAIDTKGEYEFDFISMKPSDAVYGVFRRDLADMLKDMKPGFLRFPGGCVVEGNTLDNMYKWKLSVGAPEDRKANWNRWAVHQNNGHGPFSHYNQTLGVGYFEYFLLCEYIGAKALPVCNVGLACQYESNERFEIEDDIFCCFVQDALDLIEFANGDVSTRWGALRAEMGHEKPFGLEMLGIGNEQWETPESRFFDRYRIFEAAIHEQYPDIKLIGSAGPDVTSSHYTDAWRFYRDRACNGSENFTYAVDEHYYVPAKWMKENTHFYDEYPRDVKVFAGEYAAHEGPDSKRPSRNCLKAAVAEAAFLTGLERNADVVVLASYAPLFARVGYVQWAPDMIWFDETKAYATPNYYVQQMFMTGTGSEELCVETSDVDESDGIFTAVSRDSVTGDVFVKIVNTAEVEREEEIILNAGNGRAIDEAKSELVLLAGREDAYNSIDNPDRIQPRRESLKDNTGAKVGGNRITLRLPQGSVTLCIIRTKENNQ